MRPRHVECSTRRGRFLCFIKPERTNFIPNAAVSSKKCFRALSRFQKALMQSHGPSQQTKNASESLLKRFIQVGDYLFSRAVSSELSSAQVSLTSVFGMGTGGTSPSLTPTDLTGSVYHIRFTLSSVFTAIQLFESLANNSWIAFRNGCCLPRLSTLSCDEGRAFKTE